MSEPNTPKNLQARAQRRDTVVNVRVSRPVRDLIDSAAAAVGKTRTDFIVESARREAVDVLLDQRLFTLSDEQHEAFLRTLEAAPAPAPNAKLKRLMSRKAPWEA